MRTFTLLLIIFWGMGVYAREKVVFLPERPVVDGVLADELRNELKGFADIHKSAEGLEGVNARYLLGYNSEFLYVFIEAEADEMTFRDRAYQNGDGFHLTIAQPLEDGSPGREFYVLGFSPARGWSHKMTWYYNVDLSMTRLGENVLFETAEKDGKISFELLLPWSEVHPYHPWISENIGFNLCFVKAVGENDKMVHFITADQRMQSEQSARKYVALDFEQPGSEGKLFTQPARSNMVEDQPIAIQFAGYFEKPGLRSVHVDVLNEEKEEVYSEKINLLFAKGRLTKNTVSLKDFSPKGGNYTINIHDEDALIGEHLISVFESFDFSKARRLLAGNQENISPGTLNTLQFYINELERELDELKEYESSKTIAQQMELIGGYLSEIAMQNDPLEGIRGTTRRAFLSALDTTYRPYSVYLPEDYTPGKQYPLLVYLHGSGEDDRALFRASFIQEGFVVLAPNGRGTSNCFASHEAQTDIREAIEDVVANFTVDTDKIILSGFSMGGYGVYRTYHEHPGLFAALAIISGHPDLASKWRMPNPINFLDEALLQSFSSIPIFIYHGMQDLNCPYEITEELVGMLKKYNGDVIFRTDEKAGHGMMNQQIREEYYEWLGRFRG